MPSSKSLNREIIVRKAIKLADQDGLSKVSMRKVAAELGVEAMSLYHHIKNKSELLDALVDAIFAKASWDRSLDDWKEAMRARAVSLRATLKKHSWAIGLLDSRQNPGPATLAHHDAVLGVLRRAGFPLSRAAGAYSLIDSYIYGFLLQENSLPASSADELKIIAQEMAKRFPRERYPYLAELTFDYLLTPDYSYEKEFSQGLELILESLDQNKTQSTFI